MKSSTPLGSVNKLLRLPPFLDVDSCGLVENPDKMALRATQRLPQLINL